MIYAAQTTGIWHGYIYSYSNSELKLTNYNGQEFHIFAIGY